MPSPVTEIEVDGTTVRVTNPGRVIFPATAGTPEATKLDIVTYYAGVGAAILRALHLRPTTLERWPKGVFDDIVRATRTDPHGDAFFQKRIPKGAPPYVETARITFPSGRTADEICPTEPAVAAWAAQIGTITFHPWPVRRADVDHPDELRIDLDPQPGTDFADAVLVAGKPWHCWMASASEGFPRRQATEACTSTYASNRGGTSQKCATQPSRSDVSSNEGCLAASPRSGGRRSGEGDLRRLQPKRPRPHHRKRLQPAAVARRPRVHPGDVGGARRAGPREFTLRTVPPRVATLGDPHAAIDDVHHSLGPLLEMYARDEAGGRVICRTRRSTRRCPASRSACNLLERPASPVKMAD